MRRWLVALALAVVVMPEIAGASDLRIDASTRKVTSTTQAPPRSLLPRPMNLPATVEIADERVVVRANGQTFRHAIGDLWWSVTIGDHLVVGHAATPGGHADRILAIDHTTGRIEWRRKIDSLFAASLADDLLAVERAGQLDIVDAVTGNTVGTAPLAGQGIQAICRTPSGDLHVKTASDLVAIDRASGRVRWTQPTTSRGNIAMTSHAVVDAWVDRTNHRYGIVTYDPKTGEKLESIDLGSTGGWYDVERVELAPDGAGEVLVSSVFGVS
ncbi:MAG: PQQ-binding-like beta-propeller repeat protein [Kofleriaceae bacterium]